MVVGDCINSGAWQDSQKPDCSALSSRRVGASPLAPTTFAVWRTATPGRRSSAGSTAPIP